MDGYCWWQTETTDYGVKESPWRGGKGDLAADLSAACAKAGLKLGIYLSPQDRHIGAATSGRCKTPEDQKRYDAVYRTQLEEVLSRYGEISEVWFDGSNVIEVGDILERLAPHAMVFQGPHATIRWPGNEDGYLPYPAWNSVAREHGSSGVATAAQGNPDGEMWMHLESDTTIRQHYWFHEPETEHTIKSLDHLMNTYYRSVGHGGVLLLNANPDTTGLIPEPDAKRTAEFGAEIRRRFGRSVAETRSVELDLERPTSVDHVVTMEDISTGERIRSYRLEGFDGSAWKPLAEGTAVGHKKIDFFPARELRKLRLSVLESAGAPAVRSLAAYNVGAVPEFDRNDVRIHDPFARRERS